MSEKTYTAGPYAYWLDPDQNKFLIFQDLEGRAYGRWLATVEGVKNETEANARLFAAAPAMHAALRRLVGADNCNYLRDTMRHEGYFDRAREALKLATGEDLPHPDGYDRTNDPLLRERGVLRAACTELMKVLSRRNDDEIPDSVYYDMVEYALQEGRAALAFDPNKD